MEQQSKHNTTDLSLYSNSEFNQALPCRLKRILWYYINAFIFNSSFFPFNKIKIKILRWFGAEVLSGVIIKPSVSIKYPWNLKIGKQVWIGENVWIDNLVPVIIRSNVCISQGAFLLTGNHNFSKPTFDLMTGKIILEDGCWIGAKAVVCPGVVCKSHSVLTVSSVATRDLDAWVIYQGNPAKPIKLRTIQ